ncbi:hypothetical protein JCGZ_01072 [Jatropha curcas]|uniref:RING-type E3 ubiquitin transferase n=1 Tax=Jatropha curcas TaxID=180498 RepID=A0A067L493_JATCU|nr:hypothetical protein JCGZ_01072 [Jatropha curcas]
MSTLLPPEFFRTLMFGDNDEFESFLSDDLHLPPESYSGAASVIPLLLLMGNDDDDYDLHTVADFTCGASVDSVKKLDKIRIEGSEILVCSVCLEELSIGSEATRMPCSHVYHQKCIVEWLKKSNTCPLCRYQMPTAN